MSGPALRAITRGRADVGDRAQVRATRTIFAAALRELGPRYAPIEATLPAITAPTIVLWGDRDEFFSLDDGRRLAAAIPGAQLHVLEGAGHFLARERTDEVVAAIAA